MYCVGFSRSLTLAALQKGGYNISRELAKIERDIELRQGLQPSHTLDAKWDDQVHLCEHRLF